MTTKNKNNPDQEQATNDGYNTGQPSATQHPPETGGPKGPEPTRYGDWEKNGRCSDF